MTAADHLVGFLPIMSPPKLLSNLNMILVTLTWLCEMLTRIPTIIKLTILL